MSNSLSKRIFFLLLLVISLAANAQQENIYVAISANGTVIRGEHAIQIVGEVDVTDMLEVLSLDHIISRRFDQGTGSLGGIQHGEIRLIKRVNKSSPLLAQAFAQGQSITATINFFRGSAQTGQPELFYTMQVTNGVITGISPWKTTSTIGGASATGILYEAVTLAYQHLTVTDINSGATFQY